MGPFGFRAHAPLAKVDRFAIGPGMVLLPGKANAARSPCSRRMRA